MANVFDAAAYTLKKAGADDGLEASEARLL